MQGDSIAPAGTPSRSGQLRQPKHVSHAVERSILSSFTTRWAATGPTDPILRRLWIIGLALLGAQFLAMVAWSVLLWSHFCLTTDYLHYHTAWWLIGHGDLNPASTLVAGHHFWRNDFELIMWPLALVGLVVSHGPVLGIIQDVALVIAETVVFSWMCELAETRLTGRVRISAVLAGMVLLVANPWAFQTVSYDFHVEPLGICFIVLAARRIMQGRRAGWLWVLLAVICGNATAVLVVGLGIGMAIAVPRVWRRALGVITIGAGYLVLAITLHANMGANPINLYGYLAGSRYNSSMTLVALMGHILTHPSSVISAIWAHRVNLYANIAPGGLVGIASPLVMGIWLVNLPMVYLVRGNILSQPLFQQVALYVLVPLGTVHVLISVLRRYPRLGRIFAGLLVANALAWSVVWVPIIYHNWLIVPDQTAAVLSSIQKRIPPNAEVIASFGVSGRFSDRHFDYPIHSGNESIPISQHNTYWIVVPWAGIQTESSSTALGLVDRLVSWHAHLIVHRAGVWAFHWRVPSQFQHIRTPTQPTTLPGWTTTSHAGLPTLTGLPARWTATSDGSKGYVVSGDYFFLPSGMYRANVTLSTSVPVDVEVWNDSGDVLLSHSRVEPTHGQQTIRMSVNGERHYHQRIPDGYGPFITRRTGTTNVPHGDNIFEIRVWSPGGGLIRVTTLGFQRVTAKDSILHGDSNP